MIGWRASPSWKPLPCRSIGRTSLESRTNRLPGLPVAQGESMVLDNNCSSRRCCRRTAAAAQRRGDGPLPRTVPQPRRGSAAHIVVATQHPDRRRTRRCRRDRRGVRRVAGAKADVPKLFIKGNPGALIRGRILEFVRELAEPDGGHRARRRISSRRTARRNRCGGCFLRPGGTGRGMIDCRPWRNCCFPTARCASGTYS